MLVPRLARLLLCLAVALACVTASYVITPTAEAARAAATRQPQRVVKPACVTAKRGKTKPKAKAKTRARRASVRAARCVVRAQQPRPASAPARQHVPVPASAQAQAQAQAQPVHSSPETSLDPASPVAAQQLVLPTPTAATAQPAPEPAATHDDVTVTPAPASALSVTSVTPSTATPAATETVSAPADPPVASAPVNATAPDSPTTAAAAAPVLAPATTPDAPVEQATTPIAATPDATPGTPSPVSDLSHLLARFDYRSGLSAWQSVQQPDGAERITVTDAPGQSSDPAKPVGKVMRAVVEPGDTTLTGSYSAPRSEVLGRAAYPMSSTPADRWPDSPGSERWYAFNLYVPSDFPTATDTRWLTFTQWKGYRGGSPPIALEVKRDRFRLGGTRANAGLIAQQDLGPIRKGYWTRFVVGMRVTPDTNAGWVEVWRDGVRMARQEHVSTMDTIDGQPDPTYLKQGVYRDSAWSVTQALSFSPMEVFDSRPAI